IVRDPRDVVVSNYHWEMKKRSMRDAYPIEKFVDGWMEPVYWVRVGSWGDHVTSWLSTRQGHDGFLLLRYEDLLTDPTRELAKVARILGLEPEPERLARAVELSSADRMRKLEKEQGGKWVETRNTRQDKQFVRQASSGGWRATLPAECVARIEREWGPRMKSWFRIWVLGRARFQPCRSRPGKMRALAPEGTCLPGGRAFIKPAQVFSIGFSNQKLRGKPSPSARVMWNARQFSANGCRASAYFLDAAKIKLDGPLKKPQHSSARPHARWLWLETMRSTF